MRRCVVPLFANTDSDSDSPVEMADGNMLPAGAESDDSSANESIAQEEPVDRRAGVRPAESLSDSEDVGAKTKREKFDSGVSDLLGSVSERSSSSSDQSPAGEISAPSSSGADRSSPTSTVVVSVKNLIVVMIHSVHQIFVYIFCRNRLPQLMNQPSPEVKPYLKQMKE